MYFSFQLLKMSLSHFVQELLTLTAEMIADKITVRQKAFERMDTILNSREKDLVTIMSDDKYSMTWNQLLEQAHQGIHKHNSKIISNTPANVESKNYAYVKVIQGIVQVANSSNNQKIIKKYPKTDFFNLFAGYLGLTFAEILEKVFEVFEDESMLKFFGVAYLQIMEKHVLCSKRNLTVIKISEWSSMLSYCFHFYDDGKIPNKKAILSCLMQIVQEGLENAQISTDFSQYLPLLKKFIIEAEKGRTKCDLIKVAYQICKNVRIFEIITRFYYFF